jgi:hypothetical protein
MLQNKKTPQYRGVFLFLVSINLDIKTGLDLITHGTDKFPECIPGSGGQQSSIS